jgi:hypothetical protein
MDRKTAETLAVALYDSMPCKLDAGTHSPGSTSLCVMEIVDAATDFEHTDRPAHAALPLARLAWNVNDNCPDLSDRANGIATLAVGMRVAHTALPKGTPVPGEWFRDLVMDPAAADAAAYAARSKACWLARVEFAHRALDAWTARTGIDPDPVDVEAWAASLAARVPA